MKVLVTGDREWSDVETVVAALGARPPGSIIIHGACRGADLVCAAVAEALGFVIRAYPADWNSFGKRAGPIRNQKMLDSEHVPDEPIERCMAFHNNIQQSRGTRDMGVRALRAGIITQLFTSEGEKPWPTETEQ